jgi:hypothetical protein
MLLSYQQGRPRGTATRSAAAGYYGVTNNPDMLDKWIAGLSINYTNELGSIVLLAAGCRSLKRLAPRWAEVGADGKWPSAR